MYGFSVLRMFGKIFLFSFSIRFLTVPDAIIPSISILFIRLSILSMISFLAIDLIYTRQVLVSVYFPNLYFFIHKSLLLILLFNKPMLASIFSVNASSAPRDVFSVIGVEIPRDKSLLVSRAIYLFLDIRRIVNPLLRWYTRSS